MEKTIQHWLTTTVVYSLIFGLIIPTFWSVFLILPVFAQSTPSHLEDFFTPITEVTNIKTTHYPNQYFEIHPETGESKSFIYLGDQRIAEIDQNGVINYYINDHLGSQTIVIDESRIIVEEKDYLPYGKINYEESSLGNNYGYTGKEFDEENGLQYYGQRYLDNNIGKFVSVDQVSLNLHDPEKIQELTGKSQEYILSNPQLLNNYSYTANNPVNALDPDGNFLDTLADIGFIGYDIYKIAQNYVQTGQVDQTYVKSLALDSTGLAVPGATGLGLMGRIANHADETVDAVKVVKGVKNSDNFINFYHGSRNKYSQIIKEGFNGNELYFTDKSSLAAHYSEPGLPGKDSGVINFKLSKELFTKLWSKGDIYPDKRGFRASEFLNAHQFVANNKAIESINGFVKKIFD